VSNVRVNAPRTEPDIYVLAVDIYDGDKEPIITHGGTLTSKVPLRDMCEAIAKHAFVKSPYPIIISAEIHCGLSQQDKVAEIMKQCFGDALVDKRLDGDLQGGQLPSPEMLKRRILLKVRNKYIYNAVTYADLGSRLRIYTQWRWLPIA
jgi:phosphatidylinositol phospholipase C delta